MEDKQTPSVSITSARKGHSADLAGRERRYLISMGVRTICFVLAVVTTGPVRWVFVAGALFLPYIAVVFANTAKQTAPVSSEAYVPEPMGELPDKHRELG